MVASERESKLGRKHDDTPRRTLDKQEAIRHLIHTAIRLIAKREDPFAIHVLVHSADKMLIDMAKKRGQELHFDWEWYIKPEYHKEFFRTNRAIYNYFKHADKDFDDDLPIRDIMKLNVLTLSICTANYNKLFEEVTHHMVLISVFVMALFPEMINKTAIEGSMLFNGIPSFESMTPNEMFSTFQDNMNVLPKFIGEAVKDLEDTREFYQLSFAELRAGKTKRDRIFRIREY
jgi:hypothetical protein